MTESDRDRMRAKQDKLIALAEQHKVNFNLQVSAMYPGSPTLQELRHMVYPEWEPAISHAIRFIEREYGL